MSLLPQSSLLNYRFVDQLCICAGTWKTILLWPSQCSRQRVSPSTEANRPSVRRLELKELCFPSCLQALHQLPPVHTDVQDRIIRKLAIGIKSINKKLSISGEKRIWQSSPGIPRQLQRIPGRRNYLEGKLCILLFSPAASMALPTRVIPCPSLCSSCLLQMARVVSCGTQRLWFPLHAL